MACKEIQCLTAWSGAHGEQQSGFESTYFFLTDYTGFFANSAAS